MRSACPDQREVELDRFEGLHPHAHVPAPRPRRAEGAAVAPEGLQRALSTPRAATFGNASLAKIARAARKSSVDD